MLNSTVVSFYWLLSTDVLQLTGINGCCCSFYVPNEERTVYCTSTRSAGSACSKYCLQWTALHHPQAETPRKENRFVLFIRSGKKAIEKPLIWIKVLKFSFPYVLLKMRRWRLKYFSFVLPWILSRRFPLPLKKKVPLSYFSGVLSSR